MDSEWKQRSWKENDLFLDGSFKEVLKANLEKFPKKTRVEYQLDVYQKKIDSTNSELRVIGAVGDTEKKNLEVFDAYVKLETKKRPTVISQEFVNLKNVEAPADLKSKISANASVKEAAFSKPINGKIFVVSDAGKTNLFVQDKNELVPCGFAPF